MDAVGSLASARPDAAVRELARPHPVARLLVVLTASASLRMWRDHLGVSVDEAAEDVDWAIRAAVAAARSES